MTLESNPVRRRAFLLGALGTGAGAALASPLGLFGAKAVGAQPNGNATRPNRGGYGPLSPVKDETTGLELLKLPAGFEYVTFGWTNEMMSDGRPTPSNHDGMAAFRVRNNIHVVRNHERGAGSPFAPAGAVYNPAAGGGTSTLVFDPAHGQLVESYASLSGTIRNCAGGPTPADTWLTCEETTDVIGGVRHGYVFEVPASGAANATPIKGMGRFSHEATATDPATGIVYETEDTGSSGLYRYVPVDPSNLLAGGRLEAMRLAGTTDTIEWTTGQSAVADWVTVDNPDWAPGEPSCWAQATAKGAARISRGEGAWYGNGVVYVISTSGGPARQGQVFAYDPVASTFTCVFASPDAQTLNAPDNVTVSPRGGLVLCEDGSGREFLHGLSRDGDIFPFAENNANIATPTKGFQGDFSGSEFAGATFEPNNGRWLFVNLQSPGITFAITGPWQKGAL
jgi:secreted PhoX family phosphatase